MNNKQDALHGEYILLVIQLNLLLIIIAIPTILIFWMLYIKFGHIVFFNLCITFLAIYVLLVFFVFLLPHIINRKIYVSTDCIKVISKKTMLIRKNDIRCIISVRIIGETYILVAKKTINNVLFANITANIVSFKRFCFYNKSYSTDYFIIHGFENTKNKIANFGFDVLDYKEWANQKN